MREKSKPLGIQIMGGNKKTLVLAIFCSVISGLASFIPYVMVFRTILFVFNQDSNYRVVLHYGLIAMGAIVVKCVLQGISMGLTHISAYTVLYTVRKKICEHIGKVNLGFFTDKSTGEIKKTLVEDVERIETLLAHLIPDLVVAIIVPVTAFVYLLTIHATMTLFLLLPLVLHILAMVFMAAVGMGKLKMVSQVEGTMHSVIIQFINGMSVMKIFNMTTGSYTKLADAVGEYSSLWKAVTKLAAPPSAIAKVITESSILWTLPIGGYLFLAGTLEMSSYVFFMIISGIFLSSITKLYNFSQSLQQILAGIDRIKEILHIPVQNSTTRTLSASKNYDVSFSNVSFSYDEKEVLKNINVKLPNGSVTAFVGASGAGKSTAASLIPRFWDVTNGEILIDGIDIRDIENDNLMDSISFVFQDTFMLNDTIYQNIAIGKADARQEDIERVAKAAQIHDFIVSLPKGYQTHLGEQGVKMSGGEKQRICIARAILKDAPIILFDEATSYADIENEHKIQLALSNLLVGKTTIMIAHRLHTIIHSDQICVFSQGRIVEKGTHNELVQQCGAYSKMWQSYIGEGGEGLLLTANKNNKGVPPNSLPASAKP